MASKGVRQLENLIDALNSGKIPDNIEKFSEYQQGNILGIIAERKTIARDLRDILKLLKQEFKTEPLRLK